MGPSGQVVEAVTEFCNALSTSVSEGETANHRNTSQSQHRNCGNNGEEEEYEVAVAGTNSKNGYRMHTQETAGMQIGRGRVSSQRAEDAVGRHCHQGPKN